MKVIISYINVEPVPEVCDRSDYSISIDQDTRHQSLLHWIVDADFLDNCDVYDADGNLIAKVRKNPKPWKYEPAWSKRVGEPVYFGKWKPEMVRAEQQTTLFN